MRISDWSSDVCSSDLALQPRNDGLLFSERSTTPKFNLSYKPSEDSLLYIQAAKGFRTGGINPGLPPCGATCTVDVGASFGSDSLWNYEVGTKLQLFDKALALTASAFLIDWKDIQLSTEGRRVGKEC